MGPVRKMINLACALALTGGGAFGLFYFFMYAHAFEVWMITSLIMVTVLGLYWLWEDFIKPVRRTD
jgi:hypothetical protein